MTEVQPFDWRGSRHAPVEEPIVEPEAVAVPAEEAPDPELAAAAAAPRLAELEHEAFAQGFKQGERAGVEAAGTEALGLLRRLAETIEEISATRQSMIRRTERQVVELAMAIARQMLQREITVDRGLLMAMARVALDKLGDHEASTIHLHPDDYAIVKGLPDRDWASEQVTLVADAAVERGGCLVQCDAGTMKVGLESQFNELARTLLGEYAGDTAERGEARRGSVAS